MTATTITTTPETLRANALQGVRDILAYLGENPDREGLLQTPRRVVDALAEMTSAPGDPAELLGVVFTDAGQGENMVTLTNVDFVSLCEHHLLPFTGTAALAYIPSHGRIVGLSKLARVVEHHARRPQVQERLTDAIVDDLQHHLGPKGCAVSITATHHCMTVRGIRKPGARMTTNAMRGAFLTNPETRAEFLSQLR